MADTAIEVVVQIGVEEVPAGQLWSHRRSGIESATFVYDATYLTRPGAYQLDPALRLEAGPQQTPAARRVFAAFADSAPDRWGRRVIARNEKLRAKLNDGTPRSFGEIDYLLGVRDDMRQGALRYREPAGGYLADQATGVPPLIELPQLLSAADRLERDEAGADELRMLLRGGSSLGGARPKAHVLDGAGRPSIAKFPSTEDDHDVMRWEAVALALAEAAGIEVSDWLVHRIDAKAVLVVERFDRAGGVRIGYASAMTMLESIDGEGGSYLEIADVIERESPRAGEDLRQLWRRIAFSVLISNTDDHLRNHGFLRTSSAGWTLSPAFDLNPDPGAGPKHLSTAIDFDDTRASLDTLMGVREYFGLSEDDAIGTLAEVVGATAGWRREAGQAGLAKSAIEEMAPAFEHEQTDRAREIVEPA